MMRARPLIRWVEMSCFDHSFLQPTVPGPMAGPCDDDVGCGAPRALQLRMCRGRKVTSVGNAYSSSTIATISRKNGNAERAIDPISRLVIP